MTMKHSDESRRWLGLVGLAVLIVPILFIVRADATPIRVSQESHAGAGDFHQHILGHIKPMAFNGSADEAYAYNRGSRFSFNGAWPVLRPNVSRLFFVEAREGLTLFIVHDAVDDPDGGSASMRIQVVGNRTKARFLVRDDAFAQSDGYNANAAGTDFLTWHSWYPCCTDGFVLGPFSGDWKVYVQFTSEDDLSAEFVRGLTNWEAVSDRDRIPLALERGRRVLLEPVDTFVLGPKPRERNLTERLFSFSSRGSRPGTSDPGRLLPTCRFLALRVTQSRLTGRSPSRTPSQGRSPWDEIRKKGKVLPFPFGS
jgi:hypothetical protein